MHSRIYNWHYGDPSRSPSSTSPASTGRAARRSAHLDHQRMIYVRATATTTTAWAQLGLPGWSYEDVLPHFRKSEGHVSAVTRSMASPAR